MQHIKEVHVVFKTHLDVGFTNFAYKVLDQYSEHFIPGVFAMKSENFSWTVGSWLIHEFLKRDNEYYRNEMKEAIKDERIVWNALPFTPYIEFMDRELLEYGLSLSKELDRRFGKKTISAKITDVPGLTKAAIESFVKYGIEFLHLSKNPACSAPSVPRFFRWQDDDENEIVVMYDMSYSSEVFEIPGTDKAVLLSYTNDNLGPPTRESLRALHADLKKKYPNAEIMASNLNKVAKIACSVKDTLPVLNDEIGDTWIHGTGTDPERVSNYRALLRLRKELDAEDREKINSGILLVPEHTWGLDEKITLKDHNNFIRTEFETARKTSHYKIMEASWLEQREYITNTVNSLSPNAKKRALEVISEYKTKLPDLENFAKITNPETKISVGKYNLSFNDNGAICSLERNGASLADKDHLWFAPMYEAFCEEDYNRYVRQYSTDQPDWLIEDITKVGMGSAIKEHLTALPVLDGVYQRDNRILAVMKISGEAFEKFGAPETMTTTYDFSDDEIKVSFSWYNKPANRVAEALWLGVCLKGDNLRLNKIGQWIDPTKVVEKGARALHAVDFGVRSDNVSVETLDAALVAPGLPSLLNFDHAIPAVGQGVHFNLYNNVWGTNYGMWYDEDALFRFVVRFSE